MTAKVGLIFFGGVPGRYGKVGGVFVEGVAAAVATEPLGGRPSVDGKLRTWLPTAGEVVISFDG
jgi:hypothetical protein